MKRTRPPTFKKGIRRCCCSRRTVAIDIFSILATSTTVKDNNERHEQLSRIRKDLLPLYDDVPSIAPELIRLAAGAVKAARATPTIKIDTDFGSFDGRTAEQVANEALQLIDSVRYVDIDLTFSTLCDLYISASSDEERKRILQSVETLAKHDLNAWKQVGFGVQKVLYDAICGLSDSQKQALGPLITVVCGLFLDTELQGTTWHFNSVSLQRTAVPASVAYVEFRAGVLALLFDQYRKANSPVEKMQIEQALSAATRFPMDGGSDDLIAIVLDNTKQVVDFFADRANDEPFEILQRIEQQFLWLYRRSKEMTLSKLGSDIPAKSQAVVAAIERLRDCVNAIDGFVKFKTLVGYQSVFPLEWDGDGMDIEGAQKYRERKITEYANSVTTENADEWFKVIELCAAVKSNDLATFPSFGEFLKQVAARSPEVVVGYLTKHEEVLSNFIPGILAGFAESNRPEIALSFINQWIDEGRHLHAIAHYLQYATNAAEEVLVKLGEQAIKQRDAIATIGVISAVIARQLASLVDVTFVPSIQMLTEIKDARWVNGVWYLPTLKPFLEQLSEDHCKVMIENLVLRERVEHHDERVLGGIARKYPQLVLEFFKARLDREERGENEKRYEAVSYHMVELGKLLAQHPKLVVQAARSWYSSGDNLFAYRGGRLLQNIFPSITKEYEEELLPLVQSGLDDDINFVLNLLRAYRGGLFLHDLCKSLIDVLPDGDKRIGQIQIILDSTGVVTGEFGMVEAYQRKKDEIQPWLNDPRPKVRAFAEAHVRALDREIAAEQRRSETEHELRRREWPDEEG